ncbi:MULTISPECIES: hypothetical protein [unclassified Microcoleus]|uniref:hypothetical protein n=1 Tax=unclassified Microcoleus TaxID=2642155 RepID=UPI0025CD4CA6|nr:MULTISPECIES: hypothetical protein [unclassified Microcoleus]
MSRRLRRILSKSPPPIARPESENITKTYPGTGFDGVRYFFAARGLGLQDPVSLVASA